MTNPSPETSLLEHLRLTLNLTGAKLSCNAGGCGACTVTISRKDFKGESYFSISLVLILLLFLSMSKIQIDVEFCRLSTLTSKNDCSLKNAISFHLKKYPLLSVGFFFQVTWYTTLLMPVWSNLFHSMELPLQPSRVWDQLR